MCKKIQKWAEAELSTVFKPYVYYFPLSPDKISECSVSK